MSRNSAEQFKKATEKAFTSQPNVKLNSDTMKDATKLIQSFKEEKLVGGVGDKMTLRKLAKKHGVEIKYLIRQLIKGVKVEREHSKDVKKAIEIAMDHLTEDPSYYTKLKKIESKENYEKSSRKQFAQDLQLDKDFEEFKKNATYFNRGSKFSYGIPNVSTSDPYIKKRKWSRPGKEETIESKEIEDKKNDKEMVDGIVEILKQIEDRKNRNQLAVKMLKKFEKENVKFNHDSFMKKIGLSNKTETKEATGSGSSGAFSGPIAFKDSEFLRNSFKETPKLKEGLATNAMGLHGIEKAETKEATGSGSVGGYETPAMWAKSTKKKDWGPSRKTQLPGGSFVKVKKKCTKFPYCNQGDINALKLSKNESVKEAIKSISKKYNIKENVIISILEHEYEKINKRDK